MIPLIIGGALALGAVAILSDDDKSEDEIKTSRREIPESEVPEDIKRQIENTARRR